MNDINHQLNNRLALNADELSEITGLSRWTIYTLVSERRIPFAKIGRRVLFPVKAIEKWLQENTIGAVNR